jgi:hypothetical protein
MTSGDGKNVMGRDGVVPFPSQECFLRTNGITPSHPITFSDSANFRRSTTRRKGLSHAGPNSERMTTWR